MSTYRQEVIDRLNGLHAVACGLDGTQCYVNGIGIKALRSLIEEATALIRMGDVNRENPTNWDYIKAALDEEIDDGGASQEAAIWYHIALQERENRGHTKPGDVHGLQGRVA